MSDDQNLDTTASAEHSRSPQVDAVPDPIADGYLQPNPMPFADPDSPQNIVRLLQGDPNSISVSSNESPPQTPLSADDPSALIAPVYGVVEPPAIPEDAPPHADVEIHPDGTARLPQGLCSMCERWWPLDVQGNLSAHRRVNPSLLPTMNLLLCEGSGQPPMATDSPRESAVSLEGPDGYLVTLPAALLTTTQAKELLRQLTEALDSSVQVNPPTAGTPGIVSGVVSQAPPIPGTGLPQHVDYPPTVGGTVVDLPSPINKLP